MGHMYDNIVSAGDQLSKLLDVYDSEEETARTVLEDCLKELTICKYSLDEASHGGVISDVLVAGLNMRLTDAMKLPYDTEYRGELADILDHIKKARNYVEMVIVLLKPKT